MIRLTPMTEDGFPAWLDLRLKLDAEYKIRAEGYSPMQAEELVREEYAELLPEGLDTPHQQLYHIEDQDTGRQVGAIWFEIRRPIQRAFVMDFLIYQPFRRQGYGTQTLRALEELVRGQGVSAIGLHVLGDNVPARRLYAKMGYAQTNLYAVRSFASPPPLAEQAPPDAGRAVELLPMREEEFRAYRTSLIEKLAREQMRAGHWGAAYAVQLARQEYAGRLPRGQHTPDFFYTIAAPGVATPIGAIWITRREFRGPASKAMVQELRVYPWQDREMYQRAAIRALEVQARKLRLAGVVFHLFPNEPLARLLIDELGYQVTNVFMTRTLE